MCQSDELCLSFLKHEKGSIDMFDHLVKQNNLEQAFEDQGLTDIDMKFIKEIIKGPPSSTTGSEVRENYTHIL